MRPRAPPRPRAPMSLATPLEGLRWLEGSLARGRPWTALDTYVATCLEDLVLEEAVHGRRPRVTRLQLRQLRAACRNARLMACRDDQPVYARVLRSTRRWRVRAWRQRWWHTRICTGWPARRGGDDCGARASSPPADATTHA